MESVVALAESKPARALPWLALLTVWILWGSTYLGIRVAVETMPPFLMAGVRYTIAGLLLCAITLLWNRSLRIHFSRAQWKTLAITAFLLLVCGNGALCFAEMRLTSGVAALIVATVPVWMLIIDSVLERRAPSALAIAGLVLGTLGIVALVGLRFGSIPVVPALIVLGASFAWAAGSVYARRKSHGDGNALFPAIEMLLGGLMLLVVAALSGEMSHVRLDAISNASVLGFLWLVGPGAIVGYSAYGYAVRMLPTQITATYAYVNPVVAVFLGALLAGEAITANVLIGGAAVVVSVIAILLGRRA